MHLSKIQGKTIYITENSTPTAFIVADVGYHGGVLLIRRDILPTPMRFNDYFSYYENSEIDNFLNTTYIDSLDIDHDYLFPAAIDITAESSLGLTGKDTTTIDRYAFLLSYTELGFSPSPTAPAEGKALSYFKDPQSRIACDSMGIPQSYFMRTPNTYYDSMVYSLGADGGIANGNASDVNGIRPAFCLKKDVPVTAYNEEENAYSIMK